MSCRRALLGLCLALAGGPGEGRQMPDSAQGEAAPPCAGCLAVPFIRQPKNGCGAASVAMVAHYWKRHSTAASAPESLEEAHQRLYRADRGGILLADMRQYLDDRGYHAFTFRGNWSEVERHLSKGRPVIVGLRKGSSGNLHFAVLTGSDNGHVWLNDPTRKRPRRQKRADFEKRWAAADRWVLLATPAPAHERGSR